MREGLLDLQRSEEVHDHASNMHDLVFELGYLFDLFVFL